MDNYDLQRQAAQKRFLTYDQQVILDKFHLEADDRWLYTKMFSIPYRLCRRTGLLERQMGGRWEDANTFNEVLTLLDALCDAKDDRHLAGAFQSTQAFDNQFHSGLLELTDDPLAAAFDRDIAGFHRACQALEGRTVSGGDAAYAIELLDGLEVMVQFWFADEDFPAQLQFFWDKNALQYLRYETMYYALGLLRGHLRRESLLFPADVLY